MFTDIVAKASVESWHLFSSLVVAWAHFVPLVAHQSLTVTRRLSIRYLRWLESRVLIEFQDSTSDVLRIGHSCFWDFTGGWRHTSLRADGIFTIEQHSGVLVGFLVWLLANVPGAADVLCTGMILGRLVPQVIANYDLLFDDNWVCLLFLPTIQDDRRLMLLRLIEELDKTVAIFLVKLWAPRDV